MPTPLFSTLSPEMTDNPDAVALLNAHSAALGYVPPLTLLYMAYETNGAPVIGLAGAFTAELDGVGFTGSADGALTLPPTIVASSGVAAGAALASIRRIPPSDVAFQVFMTLFVTNAAGTQAAKAFVVHTLTPGATEAIGLNMESASITAVAGSDLTWPGDLFESTAGGVYSSVFSVTTGWDD